MYNNLPVKKFKSTQFKGGGTGSETTIGFLYDVLIKNMLN
jgi:hypothetical protein